MARIHDLGTFDVYPSLLGLLTASLPALPRRQPHAFATFVRYTKMAEADARDALRYGSWPVVEVRNLHAPKYASFPGSGNVISLQMSFVQDIQSAHTTGFPGALGLLESKILHEMVHWGWHSVTLSRIEPQSRYGYDDFAWDFERDAWGAPQTVYTTGLAHVVADPS